MANGNAIDCMDLTKVFIKRKIGKSEGFTAVDSIDLAIPKNMIFGFLGPNGAGKTTTIRMLVGALKPTNGDIFINGINLADNQVDALDLVGYIPENSRAYYHDVNAKDFVRYMGIIKGLPHEVAKNQAIEKLEFVGLKDNKEKQISKMSGGQKQRVGLAQALIGDPEILICDEPTANLDPVGKTEVAKLFEILKKEGKTIFISSHLLIELQPIADMISVINHGQVVQSGTIKELLEKYQPTSYFLSVNNADPIVERLKRSVIVDEIRITQNGLIITTNESSKLCEIVPKIIAEENLLLMEFKPMQSPLERIFFGSISSSDAEEGFLERNNHKQEYQKGEQL